MKRRSPVSRSGRFGSKVNAGAALFTQSVSFDWRLWEQDILGSLAHAAMLKKIGVLNAKEHRGIEKTLKAIAREIVAGKFKWRMELEDVHMNIEAALTRREPAGAKLHTGRSRNDQVALDMRLWLREEIAGAALRDPRCCRRALVGLGEKYSDVLIPGYTHLQRAQPVYLAHHLLAYVEMLERDQGRLLDCFQRANVCPLGSGALAGSTLPLDRELVARLLGFVERRVGHADQNSMDAVSDRDFVVEFCAAAALLAVHLSRLAEDLILWASDGIQFHHASPTPTPPAPR